MVTMNAIDRHLPSEAAPRNHIIVDEIPGGLLHAVARDGSQPGSDGWAVLPLIATNRGPLRGAFMRPTMRNVRRRMPGGKSTGAPCD